MRNLSLSLWSGLGSLLLGGCAQLLGFADDYQEIAPDDDGDNSSLGGLPSSGGAALGTGGEATGGAPSGGSASSGGAIGTPDLEDFELPTGKLVYHRFTNATAGDSQMFVVDFPDGTVGNELGAGYQLCNPVDGAFSPDGRYLAFAAEPYAEPCPPANDQNQDIYMIEVVAGTLRTVTSNVSVPDNAPHFSADGSFIIFNRGGHIAEWSLSALGPLSSCTPPVAGAFCYPASGEQAKPVLSADDSTICYQEGDLEDADVFCVDRADYRAGGPLNEGDQPGVEPLRFAAVKRSHVYDARPIVFGDSLYFQRWVSESNTKKLVARKSMSNLAGKEEHAEFCTDEGSSYRDVADLGDGYLLFSTDVNSAGPTDLFIGHFDRAELLSLDHWIPGFNISGKYEYGAAFWLAP